MILSAALRCSQVSLRATLRCSQLRLSATLTYSHTSPKCHPPHEENTCPLQKDVATKARRRLGENRRTRSVRLAVDRHLGMFGKWVWYVENISPRRAEDTYLPASDPTRNIGVTDPLSSRTKKRCYYSSSPQLVLVILVVARSYA